MPSFKLFAGMTLVLGLAACGGGGGTDAGHDVLTTGHDVVTGTDVQGGNDVQPGTDGATASYGACLPALHNCNCTCAEANPDGGMGKQTCFDTNCASIENATPCAQCEVAAWGTCCPSESMALRTCVTNATTAADGGTPMCGAMDNTCLNAACMTQGNALDSCLGINGLGGTSPNPTCIAAYRPCFGDDATSDGTIMCAM